MLPTNQAKQHRIIGGQVSSAVNLIKSQLPAGVTIRQGEQYGDYTRLVFGRTGVPGEQLVMDVRMGATAAGNTPSILIRGRAPTGQASETVIGSKAVAEAGNVQAYRLETPARSIADIVKGTFKAKELERAGAMRGEKTLEQHMRSVISASSGREYEEIRQELQIPKGLPQTWGQSTPGEQVALAQTVPIVLRPSEHFSQELSRIQAQIETGEMVTGIGSLKQRGTWGAKRTSEGAYAFQKSGNVEVTQTSSGNIITRAIVTRGAAEGTTESLMKQQKMPTTIGRSRSPEVLPLRINPKTGKLEPMQAETTEGGIGIRTSRTGTIVPRAPIYARGGITYAGEGGIERNVRPMFTLFTAPPTHEGGMVISPRVAEPIAGFGFRGGGQIVDLPELKSTDLDPEQNDINRMFDLRNLSGAQSQAGARRGMSLGTINIEGKKPIGITLQKKEYLQQTAGGTLVIPPFQDAQGNFYADSGTGRFSTNRLAAALSEKLSAKGIAVENSGTGAPYLHIGSMGVISGSAKGMAGVKTAETMMGGPAGPYVNISTGDIDTVGK